MKTIPGDGRAVFVEGSQAILELCGIDYLYSSKNLTWAINQDHSVEYCTSVFKKLNEAYKRGGKAAVLEALDEIAEVLNRGQMYRY